ncbi:MAG: hypothetical protein KF916_02890 [Microbacteriaceae bacterium]|nr:hypothetical protein [Microbacteriaceae bacterium]
MADKKKDPESKEIPLPPAPPVPAATEYPRVDTAQVLPEALAPFIAEAAPEYASAVDHKKQQGKKAEATPEVSEKDIPAPPVDAPNVPSPDVSAPMVPSPESSAAAGSIPGAAVPAAPAEYPPGPSAVFVQAPTPPPARNNRLFAVLLGILAAALFGALWFGFLLLGALFTGFPVDPLQLMLDAQLYIPVGAFYVGWVLWSLLANRAGLVSWVFGSIFVGIFAYLGYLAFMFVAVGFNFNNFTELLPVFVLDFRPLLALIAGREVALWFGWLVSKRGAKIRQQNDEAFAEYQKSIAERPVVYPGL